MAKTRIATFLCEKGGDGKTNTNLSMAALAAMDGYNVAVIDWDTQYDMTSNLLSIAYDNLKTDDEVLSAIDQIAEHYATSSDILFDSVNNKGIFKLELDNIKGNLYLLPGSETVAKVDGHELTDDMAIRNARNAIYEMVQKNDLDFIFIDNGPQLTQRFVATLWCTTDIAFIMQPEGQSAKGIVRLTRKLSDVIEERDRIAGEVVNFAGVLINNYDRRIQAHNSQYARIKETIPGVFKNFIATRDAIKNSIDLKRLPWDVYGGSAMSAKADLQAVWNEFKDKILAEDMPTPLPVEEVVNKPKAKEFSL